MIVKASTGEYDDSREYTAAELASDWWWNELGYFAVVVGGRANYEAVSWPERRSATVRLGRLDVKRGLRGIYRYVDPDTRMRLVK